MFPTSNGRKLRWQSEVSPNAAVVIDWAESQSADNSIIPVTEHPAQDRMILLIKLTTPHDAGERSTFSPTFSPRSLLNAIWPTMIACRLNEPGDPVAVRDN